MDDRQILKNMVEAMKLMNREQKDQVAAFTEGLKFAVQRQAERSAEQ